MRFPSNLLQNCYSKAGEVGGAGLKDLTPSPRTIAISELPVKATLAFSVRPDEDVRPKSIHTAALQRTAVIYAVTLFAVGDSLDRQVHARIEFIQTIDP